MTVGHGSMPPSGTAYLRVVKRIWLIVLALCATSCPVERDTKSVFIGRRAVEPRLSGNWKWQPCPKVPLNGSRVVPAAQCSVPPAATAPCDPPRETHEEALHQLGTSCTDWAVGFLAREQPRVPGDLAAAWYVSAQQHDRPEDLFRAYGFAREAVETMPSAEAWFNLALIEEALGLPASWDQVPLNDRDDEWAGEVRKNRARMSGVEKAVQWEQIRDRLPVVLRTGDVAATEKLIAAFPAHAQKYLEEELPLSEVGSAQTLAEAIARRTKDPFGRDVVKAWQRNTSGIAEFRVARLAERMRKENTAVLYERAIQLLARAANPLHLAAKMRYAALAGDPRPLADATREASHRGYSGLLAYSHSGRAHITEYQSGFPEARTSYERSASAFLSVGDRDGAAGAIARKAGVERVAGYSAGALRDTLRALHYGPQLSVPKELQNVYGEAAELALHLDHRELALAFQNVVIGHYERFIRRTNPARVETLTGLRHELGIAFTHRARIYVALDKGALAARDLQTAQVSGLPADPRIASFIAMRQNEMEGQISMGINAARAAAAFSGALAQAKDFHTYRASLYVQRAEAYRRAGRTTDADADLERAIIEINEEEQSILDQRQRGANEELWPGYFARFQDAYRGLVRSLLEAGDLERAFHYTERARGYETLDLLMTHGSRSYRTRTLAEIQRALPPDTALLEYSLFDDVAYLWVITREDVRTVPIRVRRADILEWSERLGRAGDSRDSLGFDAAINAPPADLIPSLPKTKRLAIVADGPLHGVPFSALHNGATNRELVRDYILETAPSAALYAAAVARNAELTASPALSVLAVGNPTFDRSLPVAVGMPPLEHATEEAVSIAALYAPHGRTLLEADATVEAFLRLARDKDIVHFAGHAIVNREVPSRSTLLLAKSDAPHRGALDAEALLKQLTLDHTRLVVLSACSTAGGLPIGPEGVAPLVRPILGADVPAVVGSLWNIYDATAKDLLVSFHQHYRRNGDAAAALQAAQLDSLNRGGPAVQWAPFEVIGHNAPAHENDKGEPP
jgi:CHAT domain-containing protein